MDLDPLTADHPDRTLLEDEEAAAEAGAAELGRAPVVLVSVESESAGVSMRTKKKHRLTSTFSPPPTSGRRRPGRPCRTACCGRACW